MSRTYRKPHLYPYHGLRYYYRLYLRDLVIGHALHDSLDDVRVAFRQIGNDPNIGPKMGGGSPHPYFHRGSPEYEAYWGEIDCANKIRNLHAHVFRNRSSYRQRIKGIRLTKKLERRQQRREFTRQMFGQLDE